MRGYELPGWRSGKESTCQCRRLKRHRFNPWVGRYPGEGHGNPLGKGNPLEKSMAAFSRESHGQRSLVGYSPWDRKESDMTEKALMSDRNTVISGEWVKLKTWHFIREPAKSTKAVEQSITGLLAEDDAGSSGGRKAVGESRGGPGNTRLC